jgi:hypothetical protein
MLSITACHTRPPNIIKAWSEVDGQFFQFFMNLHETALQSMATVMTVSFTISIECAKVLFAKGIAKGTHDYQL